MKKGRLAPSGDGKSAQIALQPSGRIARREFQQIRWIGEGPQSAGRYGAPPAYLFVLRLRGCGFLDVGFAAALALEGEEIREAAKPQRLAHKPHRLRAAHTTRPRRKYPGRHLANTLAQHE
jgi:hypothetical protein